MSAMPITARFDAVEEDAGARIRKRRTDLGLTKKAVYERAGVDPGVLARLEKGKGAREDRIRAIELALAELEQERRRGSDLPSVVKRQPAPEPDQPRTIRVTIEGVYGAKAVTFEGFPEDEDRIVSMVQRVLHGSEDDDEGDQSHPTE